VVDAFAGGDAMFGSGGHGVYLQYSKSESGEVAVVIFFRASREPTAASRGVVHIEEIPRRAKHWPSDEMTAKRKRRGG